MDYTNLKIFSMLKVKMAYHSANQDVLAQNIANIDTPNYKARKLNELNFDKLAMTQLKRLQTVKTNPAHMGGIKRPADNFRTDKLKEVFETTPVENNVSLEQQMALVAQNKHAYDLSINLYKKTASMFRVALGKNA